jgi:hypothetical protein
MLLLPLGKLSYGGAENVKVKVSPGPAYEWDAHLKSCSIYEICKEEIEKYEKFLNIKKSKKSKSKGKKYSITEEQRKLLKKKDFEYFISGYFISLLKRNKILPYNLSRDKINELRDRAIKGSPLTKKEKEKIEILLECYNLWSSSEKDEFCNKFLTYVEKKKKS